MPAHTIVEPPRQPAAPAASAPDKTARYMARLEDHLAGLPAPQRLPRLLELKMWWISQYEEWAGRVDAGTATATDMQSSAFDWRLTIDAVSARAARERQS